MPEEPDKPDDIDWSLTTWEGSRREQLRRWSELTFDEILEAQEEMAELAENLADSPLREPQAPARVAEESGQYGKPGAAGGEKVS